MATSFDSVSARERLGWHARTRLPIHIGELPIRGENANVLRAAMDKAGWTDVRFVSADVARQNGWSIRPGAEGVAISVRDTATGQVERVNLFNAQNVTGMPSYAAMQKLSDSDLAVVFGASARSTSRDEDFEDIEISAVPGHALTQEQQASPAVDPSVPTDERAGVAGVMSVHAPYWIRGLHNYEGIQLAAQINRHLEERGSFADERAAHELLESYSPDARRLGLHVMPREQHLGDEELRRNSAEPSTLLGGALVRATGGEYRSRDGVKTVLQDKGTAVVMKDKNPDAYKAAMELAKAKGWAAIELKGKPEKLGAAWIEARMMGMEIVNYKPTPADRAALDARMAEKKAQEAATESAVRTDETGVPAPEAMEADSVEVSPFLEKGGRQLPVRVSSRMSGEEPAVDAKAPASPNAEAKKTPKAGDVKRTVARVGDSVREDVAAAAAVPGKADKQSVAVAAENAAKKMKAGWLVDHGRAPYAKDPANNQNYFVALESDSGIRSTIWGVDLERAVSEAGAKIGDQVSLKERGTTPVTIPGKGVDGAVERIGQRVNWQASVTAKGPNHEEFSPALKGLHVGPVIRVEEGLIAQRAGRGKVVWHDVSKIAGPAPVLGDMAEIQYAKGMAKVKSQGPGKELGR